MVWNRQRLALALAALATVTAAWSLAKGENSGEDSGEALVVEARSAKVDTPPVNARPMEPIMVASFQPPQRDLDPDALADLFAPTSFAPPPPPAPPLPPQTVQLAPAFPYKLLGLAEVDGRQTLFLSKQGRNFVVHAGQVLERVYRLEEIGESQAVFTYQPLNERQILPLGK